MKDFSMAVKTISRALGSRWTPVVFGGLTALVVMLVWGSLNPIPVFHDETSYLLQARIFAGRHWTAPGRPLPQFFEEYHMLVTPVLASKYPPGHALLLVPGIWLRLPWAMPIIFNGITGALIFLLARRIAGVWVALLTWFVWMIAPGTLRFSPSYLSEVTTRALWLFVWWALLEWRRDAGRGWLLAAAACVAWGVITRPFTMTVFAIPVGFVVLYITYVRKTWMDLFLAVTTSSAILLLLPMQNVLTTGHWGTSPYELYRRLYFPYDELGFHVDMSKPARSLPPDMVQLYYRFWAVHLGHTVHALPQILLSRLRAINRDLWARWRTLLVCCAILGVFVGSTEGTFAVITSILLVLSYLFYAHLPSWTVYYLEAEPVFIFLAALGLTFAIGAMPGVLRAAGIRSRFGSSLSMGLLCYLLALWAVSSSIMDVKKAIALERTRSAEQHAFRAAIGALAPRKSIVFIRYGPNHDIHRSLIWNEPNLGRAQVWTVYDRGSENQELLKLAPQRSAYLYEESQRRLTPLSTSKVDR